MAATILLFFLGLVMIVLGGDSFVGYAVGLAKKMRIPPLVVGATVVSIGTTLPEIIVSTTAAAGGNPEMAVGNALGSIICNSALIGGVGALLLPSEGISRRDLLKRLFFFLLAACFTAFSAVKTGTLGVGLGIVLLSVFAVYTLTSASGNKPADGETENERIELICVGLIVSAAALYIGSGLLVDNGIILAQKLRVPQKVIALTFVALGTSLPELATTISSVVKKQGAIGLGNIVGANILNLLLVIGLPCVIAPMSVGAGEVRDMAAAAAAMCALIVPPIITGKTYRWQGALLLGAYLTYFVVNFM
ncbi:MAG: sodium:calcium antiporter [Clostridia bacterium]